ncbi:quinoprotein dehydrogenase-associated SoxYZ-like carrier [Methyloversatilis sp.]|uniref:quinoprotein dehydrogenase-associated SoxYZ-like carrier n=1 Tax=Methyloversatilis sp. TaxID=2569862 RepID=UPI0027360810|nr:quinoprotein dehydrogenase-associated SoxYZ-like carrier [Methyloversatilis sp.]MDP2868912.1 quinoprotein dehydrogenase-associated SoxYZ-like carrier [Methyloversatilis sp.]MDP3456401.1 quinoprotein dehydrogenase-associated SoxYZ-like carrier [Methyloversatilis sp.]MDP3577741.1 quinoprotein dehydrogenase-associated SoxYZ-like carrier [Methyloversatilis sp.]
MRASAASRATRWLLALSLCLGALPAVASDDVWPRVRAALFGERTFTLDESVLALDAPDRAEDAAMVPLALHVGPAGTALRTLWLIIDGNPSPVAGRFTLHDAIVGSIETRVRIERYTPVRAVGETSDGRLYMAEHFVRAAGGCSVPIGPADDGDVPLGSMRMRRVERADGQYKVELRIRHPNHSGLEVDLDSRGYIAADYLREVSVLQDGRPLLDAALDISISRNPYLRFGIASNARDIEVRVTDSRDRQFAARLSPGHAP